MKALASFHFVQALFSVQPCKSTNSLLFDFKTDPQDAPPDAIQ
jgi:hypothetical protein